MTSSLEKTERHQHKGSQCKTTRETICDEASCKHDHHVSRHVEVSCTPVKGQSDLFDCVHEVRKA
jgi:hypothetical protein